MDIGLYYKYITFGDNTMTLSERRRYKELHTSLPSKAPKILFRYTIAPILFITSASLYYLYYKIFR